MSTYGLPVYGPIVDPYVLVGYGQRYIGTLYPDVTIEEMHRDELQITIHPVETGAPVTDHSFAMPATVEVRCAWSDSSAQALGYVQLIYQEFLALQATRQPFNVATGKRLYQNMLVRSLMVKTDEASEFALMCVAILQQIIIVDVTMGSGGASSNTDGSSSVGNVYSNGLGTDTATIAAQDAAAAGFTVDPSGNISFPNGVISGGSVNPSGITAPLFGQSPGAGIGPTWSNLSETLSPAGEDLTP